MEPELVMSDKDLKLWQNLDQLLEEELSFFETLKNAKTMEEENEYCERLEKPIKESLKRGLISIQEEETLSSEISTLADKL